MHSTDIKGNPHLYTRVAISKPCVVLKYSHPGDSDAKFCMLRSSLLLLRSLRIMPGLSCDLASFSAAILPSLEVSESAAGTPYELLSKKLSDSEADAEDLKSKNRHISRTSEELASYCLELEGQVSALKAKLAHYGSVSDESLREILSEWLSVHRGRFNAHSFSKETGIPPSRAEDGLEMLLKSGAISRIGGGYSVPAGAQGRLFSIKSEGLLGWLSGLAGNAARRAKSSLPKGGT